MSSFSFPSRFVFLYEFLTQTDTLHFQLTVLHRTYLAQYYYPHWIVNTGYGFIIFYFTRQRECQAVSNVIVFLLDVELDLRVDVTEANKIFTISQITETFIYNISVDQ